jgi:hypothetical protein
MLSIIHVPSPEKEHENIPNLTFLLNFIRKTY